MENFTWFLVSRMFIPLVMPVQPHNWEVFEWSPEFWQAMDPKSQASNPAAVKQSTVQSKMASPTCQVKPLTAAEQARHDADTIGVFEL